MVLDGHTPAASSGCSISGTVHAHSLKVEDVDLEEVAGHQLLKPGLVLLPLHLCSVSCFSLYDSYCNAIDRAYSSVV